METELWCEKYRPRTFDEIVGNVENISLLKKMLDSGDRPPHILLVGPYGLGKTTLAHIMKNYIYKGYAGNDFLELNAGDDRTIDTVRDKIDTFMRLSPNSDSPFVMLFLDEIDRMTPDAQMALNRKLETLGNNCWVVAAANLVNKKKLNEALKSRFKIIKLEPVDKEAIYKFLKPIAEKENVEITEEELKDLSELSVTQAGNVRWAINALQGIKYGEKIRKTSVIDNLLSAEVIDIYDLIKGLGSGEIFSLVFDEIVLKYKDDKTVLFDLLKIWRRGESAAQYSYLPIGHITAMLLEIQDYLTKKK